MSHSIHVQLTPKPFDSVTHIHRFLSLFFTLCISPRLHTDVKKECKIEKTHLDVFLLQQT